VPNEPVLREILTPPGAMQLPDDDPYASGGEMQWTRQQARTIDACARWLDDPSSPQEFVVNGYAGVGKTTMANHLASSRKAPIFLAYTGKAASRLRAKGVPFASTIHSALYKPVTPDTSTLTERLADRVKAIADGAPQRILDALNEEIAALEAVARQPRFAQNEESVLHDADLVVIDEHSMVTRRIRDDIAAYGKKMLVLGDPGQLKPVKGEGYYADTPPDALLTEIRRQELDSPILRYATMAREGREIPYVDAGDFKRVRGERVKDEHYVKAVAAGGQILTGKNVTRNSMNAMVRGQLGRVSPYPEKGERIVVKQNHYDLAVFNGVTCDVIDDAVLPAPSEGGGCLLTINYEGRVIPHVPIDVRLFDALAAGEHYQRVFSKGDLPVDFGYALTVHAAQGSEWDHVVINDDGFALRNPDDRKRWLYTAITRAAKRCTIVY
jgi:exodeoxyribonuclease-5